ncbi:MAG: T9SS type A sorting domain-containing protein [Spirosomataceae bacterium]
MNCRSFAQVSLTTLGTPYTQNFDVLPASGSATWTNDSNVPGWFHARTGTGTTIVANDGSSNAGNLYSYGTGTATDRALGSLGSGNAAVGNLFWGVRLQNNTGATITTLDISYTGEQWRNSAAAAQTIAFSYLVGSPTVTGSLAEFQSAGVAVSSLDFTSPITGGTAGALNGNLAANRTAITFSITGLSIPNGTEVMLRWSDPDHTGADHGLAIDDFSVTPQGGIPQPTLNISDVTQAEGNAPGTTTFTFAVTLTAPAGPGGVTFDIATADGTATTANNDYVAQSLTGQTISAGSTGPYNFSVTVNGDNTTEANETFFVNVTNITGANAGDVQGLGTINNDDVTLTPIHDIQGPGASSPLVGASVTTRGIVTGVKNNGFFIQEPEATVDADPATSEGIFVFTSSAPPAAAAIGNSVQVTATVVEFVPSADPLQPPLTELSSPTVLQLSTGNPLPVAVPLTTTFPDPAGPHDQLERVEGMRVSVASLTVSGPTMGNVNEPNATATSTGVFYGVVTGVNRPFREPGIQAPDPAPSGGGSIPPIPRFDSNPERIRVDSDGLTGGTAVEVGTGAVITGLIGPLDYTFRTYTILPDPGASLSVTGGPTATAVTAPTGSEFTVASYNLERFFDTVNDPGIGEPVLTATAFNKRLSKASLGIRNFLQTPDILGIVEMENLTTLQALASQISADAIAASQPDPQYQAFLVEGNDVGGIDVGFLVKTASVVGATPRVSVVEVVQEKATELLVNPDMSTSLLNDRPSLRLKAVVNHSNGATFPVTVIVNHLRSLNDAAGEGAGSNGWATDGARVRAKRQKQAESLADLVQARQTADPTERIILVGDFNAFEFNDGLGHSMGTIQGTPAPDNETAVAGDGADLVNPDLVNLFSTAPAADRYSFVFDGNAQSLDHILVNQPLISSTLSRREEHPRINADFPETTRNGTDATRLADHDPIVSYYQVAAFEAADLSITKTDSPDPVTAGTNLTYTITVTNNGPDVAANTSWNDVLPTGTTFVSLSSPGGWTATTPAVGSGGTITVSNPGFAAGSAVFTLVVAVDPAVADQSVLSNTATVTSSTSDPVPGNNSATATTTVSNPCIITPYTVTGGGGYCAGGTGVAVGLSGSQTGFNYQLQLNGNPQGAPVPGTGYPLSFGNQLLAGNYTVVAIKANNPGCTAPMSGSVTVTEQPVPSSALMASQTDVCPNTQVTLNAQCSIPNATVNWNPGAPTVVPDAPTTSYVYKASCTLDGCTGNESSVEVRTHRILVDIKDLGAGTQPKAVIGVIKDNLAPTNLINAPDSPRRWTILASGCSASESAVFKLSGPVNFTTVDNNPPYAIFANVGSDYFSIDHPNYGNGTNGFLNGVYTLTVDLRSQDGVGGPFPKNRVGVGALLATRTVQFTIANPLREGIETAKESVGAEISSWAEVSPNPAQQNMRLKIRGQKGQPVEVTMLDAAGRRMLQRSFVPASEQHQEEFEVSHLETGMYFLRVNSGGNTISLKLIKTE